MFFLKFYLFTDFLRVGKGGRETARETSMCTCLSHGPHWGPGPQPRHVPWLGIELETLCFTAHAQSTELHQPGLVIYSNTLCKLGTLVIISLNQWPVYRFYFILFYLFLTFKYAFQKCFKLNFIGMTLVNKIIWVSSVHFHDTWSIYCIVCPQHKVKSCFVTIYLAPFTLYCPPPPFRLVTTILLSVSFIPHMSEIVWFLAFC